MICLYAEKKSQVSAVNFLVGLPSWLQKKCREATITVECNSVAVDTGDISVVFNLDKLELCPLSCRGLLVNQQGELQMTLQYLETNKNLASRHQPDSFTTQSKLVQEIQICGNQLYCNRCGQRLLHGHSSFTRVLPLPSDNWSDYADMWFCHKHDSPDGDVTERRGSLTPKLNDCLVGTTYIMLRSPHIKQGTVNLSQGELVCSRCGICLGSCPESNSKKPELANKIVYKLYLHAVIFSQTEDTSDIIISPESLDLRLQNYLSQLILEESRIHTSFRFIISSSDNQEKSMKILLWLLDERLEVYQSNSVNNIITLEPVLSVKLLYRCLLSNNIREEDKALYKLWERDNSVHVLQLPYSLALQFVSILITSTKQLLKSTRQLNGFNVGLLRVNKKDV